MPFSRRRMVMGALISISLLVAIFVVRLAFEWHQALDDINTMIVTPVALPTDIASDHASHAGAESNQTAIAGQPTHPGQGALNPNPGPVQPSQLSTAPVHILLLGTDARPTDHETTRTDALVLVRVEPATQRVSMLSLPRDLWVSYPGGDEGRINGAYARGEKRFGIGGGPALAKATVGKLLGLKVDHFVMLNFEGFRTLIDRLGGIRINVPEAIDDLTFPTEDYGTMEVHFAKGLQWMGGERALIYARTRHADSDFRRNQRQQAVLMAIFNRIRERGLLQQLTSLDDYTGAMRGYVKTDIERNEMLVLAHSARGISPANIQRFAVDSKDIVELDEPQGVFTVDPIALRRLVAQFAGESVSSAGGTGE